MNKGFSFGLCAGMKVLKPTTSNSSETFLLLVPAFFLTNKKTKLKMNFLESEVARFGPLMPAQTRENLC